MFFSQDKSEYSFLRIDDSDAIFTKNIFQLQTRYPSLGNWLAHDVEGSRDTFYSTFSLTCELVIF